MPSIEQLDRNSKSSLTKEYTGYTPLMLAVAGNDQTGDTVRVLLNGGADYKREDEFGNTVLHIAAMHSKNQILEYFCNNSKLDIFCRNKEGETALSICEGLKNQSGVEILQKYKKLDKSSEIADKLLQELEDEEQQKEKDKEKRNAKKWRNKINKVAAKTGMSTEEVQKRKEEMEEEKRMEELRAKEEEKRREEEERLR